MSIKKICELSFLLAISLVLAYIENLLGFVFIVPGAKIGLANIVTMIMVYQTNWKQTFFLMVLRVVLSGLLFSGITGILFGFSGSVFCIVSMYTVKRFSFFSILGVSMTGAIFHNIGQLIIALICLGNVMIFYYLPWLILAGTISGICIGYVSSLIIQKYNAFFPKD